MTNNVNSVKIKDLPIYSEPRPLSSYKFVEEEKLPFQSNFATIRYAARDYYAIFATRFQTVDKALTKSKDAVKSADKYLQDEWTVLPKAAAITVGGMAGFVLGLRRYGIRKFLYAATGLVTMAAFCYPYEAIEITRTGVLHAERAWEDFQKSPQPEKSKK